MSPAAEKRYTVDEYLALEEQSEVKHEYFGGEVFAMAGGTGWHSLISANAIRALGNLLDASGCRVFSSDLMVTCPTGLRTYPDVSVTCEAPKFETDRGLTLSNPQLLVEVLSDSTEAYARGRKFDNYRTIPSLVEYALLNQSCQSLDHFARQSDGRWLLTSYDQPNEEVLFPTLDVAAPLSVFYSNVELPSDS